MSKHLDPSDHLSISLRPKIVKGSIYRRMEKKGTSRKKVYFQKKVAKLPPFLLCHFLWFQLSKTIWLGGTLFRREGVFTSWCGKTAIIVESQWRERGGASSSTKTKGLNNRSGSSRAPFIFLTTSFMMLVLPCKALDNFWVLSISFDKWTFLGGVVSLLQMPFSI